jgi:hypothetical protein
MKKINAKQFIEGEKNKIKSAFISRMNYSISNYNTSSKNKPFEILLNSVYSKNNKKEEIKKSDSERSKKNQTQKIIVNQSIINLKNSTSNRKLNLLKKNSNVNKQNTVYINVFTNSKKDLKSN